MSGDLFLHPIFWPRFCYFSSQAPQQPVIRMGYLCWDKARAEYAKRKTPEGRFRLSGVFDRLHRGWSVIIEGDPEMWHEAAQRAGLELAAFEGGTEVQLPKEDARG